MLLATGLGWVDWGVLAGYVAVVLGIGVAASRKGEDRAGYFLAGRSMPTWAVALSVLATALSAVTFIGAPQTAYQTDLSYLVLNIGGVLGAVLVAFVFLPRLYRAGTVTIYGYLGRRLGGEARVAASIAFLGGRLLASGARLFGAGTAFSLILYGSVERDALLTAIVLLGVIATAYTMAGGIRAVIWTDTLQIIVVVGVAVATAVLLYRQTGLPVGELVGEWRAEGKLTLAPAEHDWAAPFTLWTALAMTLFNAAAYGTDQDLTQRMLTSRSAGKASRSLITAILLGLPVTAVFMLVGLLLWSYHRHAPGAQPPPASIAVYPHYLLTALPVGLKGLAMAGLFAAAMSSFDSAINAMASSLLDDLRLRWPNRLAVVVMGGLLTGFAVLAALAYDPDEQTLIDFALSVMVFAYAGLLGVFLTAMLTKRGNAWSAVAALVVGGGVVTVCYLGNRLGWFELAFAWWMVVGTAASFAVCVAGPRRQAD